MASADAEDEMLATAQKFFKTKCYTTEHIKNLSVLFLKDAGKYKFFDLAYPLFQIHPISLHWKTS